MINLLIRILSFVICLGLLAGGIFLTITETMKNDEMKSDWSEAMETPWLPAVEDDATNE